MNGSRPRRPRPKTETRVIVKRAVALSVGTSVVILGGTALSQGTTAPRTQNAQASVTDTLVDALRPVQKAGRTSDRARGGVKGQRPGPSGEVVVAPIPGSQAPTLAAGRLRNIRAMSTAKLVQRLAPNRGNSAAERTAVFRQLGQRGVFLYYRDTGKLYFVPRSATKQGERARPPAGNRGSRSAPARPRAGQVELDGQRMRVLAAQPDPPQGPGAPQAGSQSVTGGRLEIPTGPKSFVFIQGGANERIISLSGGAGVGTPNGSFIGTFRAPPTGVNFRGEVTLSGPGGSLSGRAAVNFNPVTGEFSGGGSGTVELQGPGGKFTQSAIVGVKPNGEVTFRTERGTEFDLGTGQKVTLTQPSQASDGTQVPPAFQVSPSDQKGITNPINNPVKVSGRLEADATANVPVDSILSGKTNLDGTEPPLDDTGGFGRPDQGGQQAPGDQRSPGDLSNSPEVGGRDADRQAPAEQAPGDQQSPGDEQAPGDQRSPGDLSNSPEVGGRDADRQAPAEQAPGDEQVPGDQQTPGDQTSPGDLSNSPEIGGRDADRQAPADQAPGGVPGDDGNFGEPGAPGDSGGGFEGGGDFSGGFGGGETGDFGGGGGTGDFGGGETGDFGGGGGDFGGGGGDFGGGGATGDFGGGGGFDSGGGGGFDSGGGGDFGGGGFDSGGGGGDFGGGGF